MKNDAPMLLCKDCKYFCDTATGVFATQCGHAKNMPIPDYVAGGGPKPIYSSAQACRVDTTMCGPEGRWFTPRADEKAAA